MAMNNDIQHTTNANAMQQQEPDVDKFLRQASFEVQDEGFSDRVLQALPEHVEWERRLNCIWQLVCLSACLIIGWWTHALDTLLTDLRVFLHTLTYNYDVSQLLILASLPMLLTLVAIVVWNKKLIY